MFESDLMADAAQFAVLGQRIAAAVSTETSGPVAASALAEVLAGVRAGELATCRLVERVDRSGEFAVDGAASTVAYLRNVSGEGNGWAAERVLLGRALADRMPATANAWQSGAVGLGQASIIRKTISRLEDDLAGEIDKVLAEAAPQLTPAQLAELGEVVKAAAAPEQAEADAKADRAHQTLSISRTFDGRYRLDAWLDSEAGAEIAAALAEFTRPRDPNLSPVEDPIAARRAEALHQLARHATPHAASCHGDSSSPSRHSLIVATTLEALQSGLGAADIQGHGTLTARAARRLACDWGIIPAVLGTDSEILDLGTRHRLATPLMRRHIALRDGGCLFPGCDRPPSFTEAHHRKHYIDGGPTEQKNLDSFCPFHHHLVHEGGWSYRILDATTLQFTPPDGRPPSSANAAHSSNPTSTNGSTPNPPSPSKPLAEHEESASGGLARSVATVCARGRTADNACVRPISGATVRGSADQPAAAASVRPRSSRCHQPSTP
jgi:hypothetical protein